MNYSLNELRRAGRLWHLGAMATAPRLLRRFAVPVGKGGFAKRARGFAKRVGALPGFRYLALAMLGGTLLMTVTGGFETSRMPWGPRALFWVLLFGWGFAKWQLWFALMVHKPGDWLRAALLGAVLLNALLPLEIGVALSLFGVRGAPAVWDTWIRALAISGGVFLVMSAARRWHPRPVRPLAPIPASPLLARAGVAPESLVAIHAEDHYCRVCRVDGGSALIHYRFGDALAEMAGSQGAQVHRGTWVAAASVRGAVREGRRWRLQLVDGTDIPVSASYIATVRARGWLRPPVA